ncbi:hypothetical protein KIN20_028481 [Parelaphostrongylus tenuis]|uniref:Uncharacterized protein n=1 Tax=Parelaphostrongylus tenuis TaxID=148309 RepID=A0AAD5R0W3_PARTN|nr:hypothetical protein KIN20_028481 [Parelaphostrongylus tenuis]
MDTRIPVSIGAVRDDTNGYLWQITNRLMKTTCNERDFTSRADSPRPSPLVSLRVLASFNYSNSLKVSDKGNKIAIAKYLAFNIVQCDSSEFQIILYPYVLAHSEVIVLLYGSQNERSIESSLKSFEMASMKEILYP